MSDRRIFIGDVHGHYKGLILLLDAIAPTREDKIYFLGDLVDRGPQSAEVVSFVMENQYACLLGNHEQMMLDILTRPKVPSVLLQSWLESGGRATMDSYGKTGIIQEHLEWMEQLPTYLDLDDIWLVHAGLHPQMPLEEQTSEQFCWIRDEFHSMKKPYFPDKLIITGHTITFTFPGVLPGKLVQGPGWLDIETGAYHRLSGWLTGLDMTHKQVYQVHVERHYVRKLPLEEAVIKINPSKRLQRPMMRSPFW